MNKTPKLIGQSSGSLREVCGETLTKLAATNEDIIVLDGDVAGGTGMHHFRKEYPSRFIQCGIAEQNMMAMAGGLAAIGFMPVVTSFAVFMLRAIEQVRLSIAYADMNVKIIASHPGLDVGPDGASAQCLEDIACFRSIPNMIVLSPCDPLEMAQATKAIFDHQGPVYMRTGRSESSNILNPDYRFELGKGQIIKPGKDLTLMGCGVTTGRALTAARRLDEFGISTRVVNMSTIKPIDKEMICKCSSETKGIITIEDHNVIGGLGSAVSEVVAQHCISPLKIIGVQDCFGESGEPDELAAKYGIDADSIFNVAKRFIKELT